MKKLMFIFLLIVGLVTIGMLTGRFFFGGDEDTWICENGEWIMHGKPRQPKPMTKCGEVKEGWQKQTFNEAGLSLSLQTPTDTTFRKEIAEDGDRIRAAAFYVERGEKDNPTYQLYALYQPLSTASELDLERAKTGMDPKTVKEVTIGGYKGIEGLTMISGPKNHYETVIVKDGKLFSIATWPPTEENKTLTDEILSTFKFEESPKYSVTIAKSPVPSTHGFSFEVVVTNQAIAPYITNFAFYECEFKDRNNTSYQGNLMDEKELKQAILPGKSERIVFNDANTTIQGLKRDDFSASTATWSKCDYNESGENKCNKIEGIKITSCKSYVSSKKSQASNGWGENPLTITFPW